MINVKYNRLKKVCRINKTLGSNNNGQIIKEGNKNDLL